MAGADGPVPTPSGGDFETAVTGDDRLELRVWLRLLTCCNLIERGVRRNLRDAFDTTLPRFDLLAQLDRAPEGLTMGALSRRLMVSNGNVTGLINRLVEEGLVARRAAKGDRRTQLVKLTAAGGQAFDRMAAAHATWINEMLTGLDRGEMTQLLDLLARLKGPLVAADRAQATPA